MYLILFVMLGVFSLPLMADGTSQTSEPQIPSTSSCKGGSCPVCHEIQMPKIP